MTPKRTWRGLGTAVLLVAGLTACGQSAQQEDAPARESLELQRYSFGLAEIASLDVYADSGTLHMLVAGAETADGEPGLRYVRSTDEGDTFSEPVTLGSGQPPPKRANRGDDVQIAADGERLVALWQIAGTGFAGAGPMATALSSDAGESWRAGPNPAADDSRKGHGFADLLADGQGRFHLIWLDSRGVVETLNGKTRVADSAGQQGLMYARSRDGGRSWGAHTRIDGATCECCWNTLREGAGGRLYVLYRDIAPRDMALAVSSDAGTSWRRRGALADFGWDFEGCPHVGGGLTATGKAGKLAATVWTGKAEEKGLYALRSENAGRTWSAPTRLEAGARHSDLAVLTDGTALAVWDAAAEDGKAVYLARKSAGSATWSAPRRLSKMGARASHPRVAAIEPNAAAIVWTVKPKGGARQVAVATLKDEADSGEPALQKTAESG